MPRALLYIFASGTHPPPLTPHPESARMVLCQISTSSQINEFSIKHAADFQDENVSETLDTRA